MRIVFMGTPNFAVPCLEKIIGAGNHVEAVFTQPDRPRGRGYKMEAPPVKVFAASKGIPVLQPESVRDGKALDIIQKIAPDAVVVVAYGKILPAEILKAPRLGCINVHASLLPKLRGASPIQSAILQGETVTGVTTMLMNEGMDTGDILKKAKTPIGPDENAIVLQDRLSVIGAELIVSTLNDLENGDITPKAQDNKQATYAPILKKEMGRIHWHDSSLKIHNQIRGLQPWPNAVTKLDGKNLKIYKSRILADAKGKPGELLAADKRLVAATGDGALELLELQLEGARRMPAEMLLRGRKITAGGFLGE